MVAELAVGRVVVATQLLPRDLTALWLFHLGHLSKVVASGDIIKPSSLVGKVKTRALE